MHLKKISKIKAASFDNFLWSNTSLEDFTDTVNIILGWNGTGKTVISRVLRSFELEKISDKLNKNGDEFSILIDTNTHNQDNLDGFKNSIRVFNEDYIKEKIQSGVLPHVVYVGDDAIDYAKKDAEQKALMEELGKTICIDDFLKLKELVRNSIKRESAILGIKKQYEDANYASYDIKSVAKNLEELERKQNEEGLNIDSLILTDSKLSEIQEELKDSAGKNKSYQKLKHWNDWLISNSTLINATLSNIPTQKTSERIAGHNSKPGHLKWIEDGVRIHDLNGHNPAKNCLFCNSIITNKTELIQHFSQEVLEANQNINNFLIKLSQLEDQLSGLGNFYDTQKTSLLKIAQNLKSKLQTKRNDITSTDSVNFIDLFENEEMPESDLSELAYTLEDHYVASIFNEFFSGKKIFEECTQKKDTITENIRLLGEEIQELKDRARNIKVPADAINALLKTVFPHKNIELSGSEDGLGYKITRGGILCSLEDLSEGERNFIALAYFLKTLNTKDEASKLDEEGIVIIDDPVSSLDKNSLFQIFAIIAGEISLKPQRQYFILTHSLEFFAHVFKHFENKKKDVNGKTIRKNGFYQLYHDASGSRIGDMHKMLRQFQTDYRYATSTLFELKDSQEYEDAYLAVNLLRRVWETFIHFKFGSGDLRSKLKDVYKEAAEIKIQEDDIENDAEKEIIRADFENNHLVMYKFIHHGSHEFLGIDTLDDAVFGTFPRIIENFFEIVKLLDKHHHKQIYKKTS